MPVIVFIAVIAVSWLGVRYLRRSPHVQRMLDVPNERSSHVHPTPRGGGLVIVILTLLAYDVGAWLQPDFFSWGYLAGAVLVAGVSLLDDVRSISVGRRLAVHSAAAALLMWDVGYWHDVHLPRVGPLQFVAMDYLAHFTGGAGWELLMMIMTFAIIVWLINAYNFMDGIDGIAGVQAVGAAIGWIAIGLLWGAPIATLLGGAVLASTLGFLIHNWQPAKIFMGDVGSAFLGFTAAAMPLMIGRGHGVQTLSDVEAMALLLVWPFLFDSLFTFVRRLLRGEKVWQAHRDHIYQLLVRCGLSHGAVSAFYGLLSLSITAAVAFFAARPSPMAADLVLLAAAAVTAGLVGAYVVARVRLKGAAAA